ncbi:MAG TPA: 2-oxoacid:ferredoxin oxidoreductase subunit beta [Atribacterota bacterium]|nr:2-oxoacid:ferredoxin oxidoreductase subunit beta [Atribacterota bacterium]
MNNSITQYFRKEMFPHIWCPGCGIGIILGSMLRAIQSTGWEKDEVVMVSGIGCSSRITGYVDFNTMNTTHGRALPFATGIKMANPALKVITVMGDGDCAAIGGNHFIHSARRNIDITAIIINNMIYGMTGGQYSPLTPTGKLGSTAPYGNIDQSFDIAALAASAGASYVARGNVFDVNQITHFIKKALLKKGFSVVEIIADCPISFGRINQLRTPVQMLEWIKSITVAKRVWEGLPEEEKAGKIPTGEFLDIDIPEYTEKYQETCNRIQQGRREK